MKKIQKFIKKNSTAIVCFIIGLFITAAFVFYAAEIKFASANVSFDNSMTSLSSTNVQSAIDELKTKYNNVNYNGLLLGDYFTMVPDASTYTITAGTTGYDSDQTITPNELTLWRVIDIHSDGSVDAVSEYVSSTSVYFKGVTGYANFVGALQTIATQYAKAGYTIDTRMMGYGGQTATIQPKSETCTGTCQTTTTYAFDGSVNTSPGTFSTPYPYTGEGQEYNRGVLGDNLYLKDIQLVGNVYKTDTTTYGTYGLNAYIVNATTTSGNYWISSRHFGGNNSSCGLYGLYVANLGTNYFGVICSTNVFRGYGTTGWNDIASSSSLRPIITLKSGITLTGGSGTKADPFTISA